MELELWVIVLLAVVYFTAGFIDSIAGGGGLLTVPAFLLTGLPPEVVLGTNKLASCCGMLTALGNYARSGLVYWRALLTGVPAVILGGLIGSWALLSLDSAVIGKVIVFLLPLGIIATLTPKTDRGERPLRPLDDWLFMPLICLVLGAYEGFFGPGTGSFFLLALHFLLGFSLLRATATTKLLNLCGGLSAVVMFITQGKVLFLLGLPLAAANIAGNYLGSRAAMQVGPGFIKKVLSFSLTLLFISLIWKFWIDS